MCYFLVPLSNIVCSGVLIQGQGGDQNDFCVPKIFKNNRKNNRNNSLLFKTMAYCLAPLKSFSSRKPVCLFTHVYF